MIVIENNNLIVKVNPQGAELTSVIDLSTNEEFIWQAGTQWPKHAPILFPIVGTLNNNQFCVNETDCYELSRHGFAREQLFTVLQQSATSVQLSLKSNEQIFAVYPFYFEFIVSFELNENNILQSFEVRNLDNKLIPFSFGAHPAFNVGLETKSGINSSYLEFSNSISADIWPLNNGLIENKSIPFIHSQTKLPLSYELFFNDALVFKQLNLSWIAIHSIKSKSCVKMYLNDCPFFGIWSAKNADFVCLEPWWGIADTVNFDGTFFEKEGIISLEQNGKIRKEFRMEFLSAI